MPSAWFGLNTGLSALRAAQTALDTAAHNTANASTPGYSRQRVNLVASAPFTYPSFNRSGLPGQIGTGVSVSSIMRIRDVFLDRQINVQVANQGYWDARRDELSKVETVFPEPSATGLGTALSRFWAAWHDVAADPTSTAARAALVSQAGTLANRFARDAGQLDAIAAGVDDAVRGEVAQVNDIATRLAGLNLQIQRVVVSGDHANDLSDERDRLLDELSRLVPVTVEPQPDGTVTIQVGGTDLVNRDRARTIVAVDDGSGHLVPEWSTGGRVELHGDGSIAGRMAIRDTELAAYRARLDELAGGIADAVNAIHVTGVDQAGNPAVAVFTYTVGSAAATLAVNAALVADPRLVASAAAAGTPGDGTLAGAIADLQRARILAGGTQTPADAFAGLVARIGTDSRQASEIATSQELVVGHLVQRRESNSGVSLDEEAADMIRFQHAYTAAARVITTIDQMLDTLINRTGIVGR